MFPKTVDRSREIVYTLIDTDRSRSVKEEKEGIMARIVKEPAIRRNEILDVAERLVATKGYEQMAIQDILDELQISKGAFYHYFDSKLALLSAVIERLQAGMEPSSLSLVHDPALGALDKLQRFFATLFRWKTAQKGYFLLLLRAWYTDDNALVRQKVQANMLRQLTPPLENIIHQGIQEGVLTIPSAEGMGRVTLTLAQDLSDLLAGWLLSAESQRETLQHMEHTSAIYSRAVERVLGAPSDSVQIFDMHMLGEWVDMPREKVSGNASERERA
jgi:AcrR family transcriptional regulator